MNEWWRLKSEEKNLRLKQIEIWCQSIVNYGDLLKVGRIVLCIVLYIVNLYYAVFSDDNNECVLRTSPFTKPGNVGKFCLKNFNFFLNQIQFLMIKMLNEIRHQKNSCGKNS